MMTRIGINQRWKYDYGPSKCNYLTVMPLLSLNEIAYLLLLPHILIQQYLFLCLGACIDLAMQR